MKDLGKGKQSVPPNNKPDGQLLLYPLLTWAAVDRGMVLRSSVETSILVIWGGEGLSIHPNVPTEAGGVGGLQCWSKMFFKISVSLRR